MVWNKLACNGFGAYLTDSKQERVWEGFTYQESKWEWNGRKESLMKMKLKKEVTLEPRNPTCKDCCRFGSKWKEEMSSNWVLAREWVWNEMRAGLGFWGWVLVWSFWNLQESSDSYWNYQFGSFGLETGPNGLKWVQSKHRSWLGQNALPSEPKFALILKLHSTLPINPILQKGPRTTQFGSKPL